MWLSWSTFHTSFHYVSNEESTWVTLVAACKKYLHPRVYVINFRSNKVSEVQIRPNQISQTQHEQHQLAGTDAWL